MTDRPLREAMRLEPLKRISPSRYTALLDCALREVWAASGNSPLLPVPAAAHVGTIAHAILDRAAKGEFRAASRAQIEAVWDSLVAEKENQLLANPVERLNVPLRERVFRYAVRRIRTIRVALELSSRLQLQAGDRREEGTGSEQWVESADKKIGGYIDRVIATGDGPIIRDYKSGAVMDDGEEVVRAAYSTQLKLYAKLYFDQWGKWPVALELAPLRGVPVQVPFSRGECDSLLSEAVHLLEDTNAKVRSGSTAELAAPAAATCKYCPFRPSCASYRAARDSGVPSGDWPLDVWGYVQASSLAGDGRLALQLEDSSTGNVPLSIVGLTNSVARHPALSSLEVGTYLAVFGLRGTPVPLTYSEGPNTILYVEREAAQAN